MKVLKKCTIFWQLRPEAFGKVENSCFAADWREEDEDPAKAELWEADWDDTSVSDNFSQQLRAELQKHSKK